MPKSLFALFAAIASMPLLAAATIPAGPLPRQVVPTAYTLDLEIDPRAERYRGEVAISLDVREPLAEFHLHARDSSLGELRLSGPDGASLAARADVVDGEAGIVRIRSAGALAPGAWTLRLRFDAPFNRHLQGAYKLRAGNDNYVMTQMEPISARNAFPCFDEPAFKTPWTVTISAPKQDVAIFNSRETASETRKDGWVRHRYATTPPLPSYLIAFAVGPWDVVEAAPIAKTALREREVPLRGIAARGQGERMRHMLGQTAALLLALEDYFSYPYPFDKLDLLAAPDFNSGAMENPGLIAYRDAILFVTPDSSAYWRRAALTTHAHELGHQWFGNLVTMPWWDDLWLNEAFATWIATKVVDAIHPGMDADVDLLNYALYAMDGDSLASARRIRNPVAHWTDIRSAFDGITYDKGGAVLSMLEGHLGAPRFRDAMRAHVRKFAHGNASSDDLADALARHSSTPDDLRRAFASFIDQPGVPMLDIAVSCTDGQARVRVRQSRYAPIGAGFSREAQWQVPMCLRVGRGGESLVECHLITAATSEFSLAGERCPDFVHPNADGIGYYRFRLDTEAQAALADALERLNRFEQRVLADSLDAAFASGDIDVEHYLEAAPRFATAADGNVVSAPLATLRWIRERVADADQAERVDRLLREAWGPRLRELGIDPRAGESEADKVLRMDLVTALSTHGRPSWLIDALSARGRRVLGLAGDGDDRFDADAVHRDLLSTSLRAVVRSDGEPAFERALHHFATQDDAVIRGALLNAVATSERPELTQRALAFGLSDEVKASEMDRIYYAATRDPSQRDLLWRFVREHYDALLAKAPALARGELVYYAAPVLCSKTEAESLQRFFMPRAARLEGGPRAVAQAVESVQLCAAKVARHKSS
jgi:alanyl aminopeptidase